MIASSDEFMVFAKHIASSTQKPDSFSNVYN